MRIELPILVETRRHPEGGSLYHVRPLFFSGPIASDRHLSHATSVLTMLLKRRLDSWGRSGRHRELADYTFSPEVELHRVELVLDLRGTFVRGWFPVATFQHFGRSMAFSPYVGEVWFDVPRGRRLADRAQEVYTRHFRDLEKEQGNDAVEYELRPFREKTRRWLSLVELDVSTRQDYGPREQGLFALFGGGEVASGPEELERVGRSLDRLYPDHLERALLRGPEVDELEKLLESDDLRPVMLAGPPMVGKTALVHELVYRRVGRRRSTYAPKENVWLLAPQRLISGMSYVGQWENRLLAILKTARKRRHVLYFDDVLGLYRAGVTWQSSLSVADVLKPYVERREVRVLAEMTPEALRVFRERDRGFADQFHVIPVEEPGERQTLRILMGVVRRLEARYRVRFGLEVLPTVLELTRRYQREEAYPGKAARWLGQLAVKYQGREVDRRATLEEFHAKSGLEVAFLDARARLRREEVTQGLSAEVIGQKPGIEAMSDVVSVAKARLNDPGRPLGTLFFLGPTGVGKTQSAKALAKYLFGDATRLLRLDMNEFVSAQSAARLVGTFDQPEGLLTSAMRRQPFAVVLFDEIEKAHPDVFDLLLQILGEARLTDALGRTADFSNAIVILTSNLGTREASRELGFGPHEEAAEAIYLRSVREFFRPEFFNRLDRVVPFTRLDRSELAQIARAIIADVTGREGLARRRCAVDITGDAVDWIIEQGFHRMLGARAMRRAVEREMVRPVAVQLAAISPSLPTVLRVGRRGERLAVEAHGLAFLEPLASAARRNRLDDVEGLLARSREAIDRIGAACTRHRPRGELIAGSLPPQYHWYLGTMEFLRDVRGLAAEIADRHQRPRRSFRPISIRPRGYRRPRRYQFEWDQQDVLEPLCALEDIHEYLESLASQAAEGAESDELEERRHLLDKLALLEMLGPDDEGWSSQRVAAIIRSLDHASETRDALARCLEEKFQFQAGFEWRDRGDAEMTFGLEVRRWEAKRRSEDDRLWWETIPDPRLRDEYRGRLHLDVLVFEGHRAQSFLALEHGTHLFVADVGVIHPIQVAVVPMDEGQDMGAVLAACLGRHDRALEAAARGDRTDEDDPFAWQPILGIYVPGRGLVVDQRSDLTAPGQGLAPAQALMAALALPPELRGYANAGE